MKRLFLVNPNARNGRRSFRRELPKLAASFPGIEVVVTTSWQEARDETRRALHAGFEQIVAVGGDGTLNALINGFFENGQPINEAAELVPTNCGTGSDYFKAIAGQRRFNWTELVTRHEARPVDVGCIEPLEAGEEPRYFLNMASVGISPAIASNKWRLPFATPSALSYLLPTLRAIVAYRPLPVAVRGEDFQFEGDVLNCFIAKGTYCGGGMRFGGAVSLDDGRFDVTVIGKMRLAEILKRLPLIYGEGLHDEEKIRRRRTRWLEIHSPQGLPVECDGEVRARTDVRFRVLPRAVRVGFPISVSEQPA